MEIRTKTIERLLNTPNLRIDYQRGSKDVWTECGGYVTSERYGDFEWGELKNVHNIKNRRYIFEDSNGHMFFDDCIEEVTKEN